MLAAICDGTWNVLNMQHITPNMKRWDYSDISISTKRVSGAEPVNTGWETKNFWHSPKLGSLLYSLYKIPSE